MEKGGARICHLQCIESIAWTEKCGRHARHLSRDQLDFGHNTKSQAAVLRNYFPLNGGGGYSGSLLLLTFCRLTSSSSNRIDGLMMLCGIASVRLSTFTSSDRKSTRLNSSHI